MSLFLFVIDVTKLILKTMLNLLTLAAQYFEILFYKM